MGAERLSVLFICVHNSARSQLAEELLRKYGGGRFDVESAGLEPGSLNPYVVRALREDEGIDISGKKTQSVMDRWKSGKFYNYVVTVCSAAEEEKCPVFPRATRRLHWPFSDPSKFKGTDGEIVASVIGVKNEIKERILRFIREGS